MVLLVGMVVIALAEGEPARTVANTVAAVMTYTTNWALLAGVSIERHAHAAVVAGHRGAVLRGLAAAAARGAGHGPRRGAQLLWLTLGLAVASALWRVALWESGRGWEQLYLRTDARADSLLDRRGARAAAMAATGGRLHRAGAAPPAPSRCSPCVAAAEALKASSAVLYLGGYTVVAVLAAVLIAAVLPGGGALATALGAPALVAVGSPVLLAVPLALPALRGRRRAHRRVADGAARRRRLGADLCRRGRVVPPRRAPWR